jgi:hypothetical protein
MRTTEEEDEQFYRDTESIAFPALSDEQLATLESLGTRRKVNRGEIIYKTGQRDVPFHLVLSGELEVFESRDGEEQILGVPGPRDFVGDISMLTGTAVVATVRGKAEESELLQIPSQGILLDLGYIFPIPEFHIWQGLDKTIPRSECRMHEKRESLHNCPKRTQSNNKTN